MTQLKAADLREASTSIIVSFHHNWLQPLLNNDVSVIFRKRGPRQIKPAWIYVYVGQPESSIIGRLPIKHYSQLNIAEALQLSQEGQISKHDLQDYAGTYKKLAVFRVETLQRSSPHISRKTLVEKFNFFPPQSFLILSTQGKILLDELAGFESEISS